MINSVPKTSLAGTFYMEIDALGDANVEVQDFGRLEYEFDLVPTQATGARISGIPGTMTVKVWDKMSNQGSFYDSMESYIGEYDSTNDLTFPRANVNVVWTTRSENVQYKFPFSVAFNDIGLDERSQTATVKLQPKSTNINIGTWGATRAPLYTSNEVPYFYDTLTYLMNIDNCVPAGIAIYDIIGTLDTATNVINVYETAKNIGTIGVTGVYGSVVSNFGAFPLLPELAVYGNGSPTPTFIFNGVTTASYDQSRTMQDVVKQYAAMEGAIFGSAFGVNFYINRTINTYNVEITNAELEDLSFVTVPRAYNAIGYTTQANDKIRDGIGFSNTNITFEAWRDAPQTQQFKFTNYDPYMVIGCFEGDAGVSYGYSFVNNSGPISANLAIRNFYQDALFTKSFQAFAAPLGITATNRSALKIEATLLGTDKIRPYEVIKFDNTVPIRYQGKHFRPTSLSYDLKADKVKVTAYQIDTFLPPAANFVINVGNCDPMFVVNYTAYNTSTNVYSDENSNTFLQNITIYNTFTNVFADETGENTTAFMAENSGITAFSNADGNVSNVTSISL